MHWVTLSVLSRTLIISRIRIRTITRLPYSSVSFVIQERQVRLLTALLTNSVSLRYTNKGIHYWIISLKENRRVFGSDGFLFDYTEIDVIMKMHTKFDMLYVLLGKQARDLHHASVYRLS